MRLQALTVCTLRWAPFALVLVVLSLLLFRWAGLPTGQLEGDPDAQQNFRMAYHFSQHGTLSLDPLTIDDPKPTNYREPLPPLVQGLYFRAAQYLTGLPGEYFLTENGRRAAKLYNIFWAAILCLSIFYSITSLTGLNVLGAIGALFMGWNVEIDSLMTELPATALLVLFSFLGLLAVQTRRLRYYLIAGLAAGALVLTKGAFLYIVLAVGICLAWLLARQADRLSVKRIVLSLALFTVGVSGFIAPWLVRNYHYYGSASITERSGVVLMIRANADQMTWTEYLGSFYAWTPGPYQEVTGRVFGFTHADLMKSGRLQRLTGDEDSYYDLNLVEEDLAAVAAGKPEKATGFHLRAWAEQVRLSRELLEANDPIYGTTADLLLRKRAMQLILDHPVSHLLATVPFLWRGTHLSAPLLAIFVVIAAMSRRRDIVAYVLPTIVMMVFYAVASHNIPRYNVPAEPVVIIAAIATVHLLQSAFRLRLERASGSPLGCFRSGAGCRAGQ
jgi:4-amino-4-deoxy-L-arabinose transferase-like glycosyltransferase